MDIIIIDNTEFQYDATNVKIVESYKITNPYIMENMLHKFKQLTNYHSKRSIKGWIKEWKAHNRLYKFRIIYKPYKRL